MNPQTNASPEFGRAVEAYTAFRPAYPAEVFERILARVPPGRRERAMDLGAGTGLSTAPLCAHFREVIAVEPDAKMAAHLPALAVNLTVRQCAAEDAAQPPASVDLVTCFIAFYWMDGPRVLARAREWLRPDGTLALYRGTFPRVAGAAGEILARESSSRWDAFRHPRLRDQAYSERTVRAVPGFADVEVARLPFVVELSAAQLAGFMSSTSYGHACARSLPDGDAYWRALTAELQAAAPRAPGGGPGAISADFGGELILATRA